MKNLYTTVKYAVVITLVLAGVGGWYAYRQWESRSELIRQHIIAAVAELAPHWDIDLEQCRFDFLDRIRIDNVSLKAHGQTVPLIRLPQVFVTVDAKTFFSDGEVQINKIRLIRPTLELTQGANGHWNWEALLPFPQPAKMSLPECEIQDGILMIRRDQGADQTATRMAFSNISLRLIPSGKRRFQLEGDVSVGRLGHVSLSGGWDVDKRTGSVNGAIRELALDRGLMEFATRAAPSLRERITACRRLLEQSGRMLNGPAPPAEVPTSFSWASQLSNHPLLSEVSPVGAAQPISQRSSEKEDSLFDISAVGNVHFRITQSKADSVPEFQVLIELLRGEIHNPLLPIVATTLSGKLYCDRRQFIVRNVTAGDGVTTIGIDGAVRWCQQEQPARFNVTVENLVCDERFRNHLPDRMRRTYDLLRPHGRLDATFTLEPNESGVWQPKQWNVTVKNGSISHVLFPYPIDQIEGTIVQRGQKLDINAQGLAHSQVITIDGSMQSSAPGAESQFDIRVKHLPFDKTFLAACPPSIQMTLASLHLTGLMDVDLTLFRPAGLGQHYQPQLALRLHQGTLQYEEFPYSIDGLAGNITWIGKTWRFQELTGTHGSGELQAAGSYLQSGESGKLHLTIGVKNAVLDESLRLALSPTLQSLWSEMAPAGTMNLTMNLNWGPGQPIDISCDDIDITNGRVKFVSFPYPIDQIRAHCRYRDGELEIQSFHGVHDDVDITSKGLVRFDSRGDWTAKFIDLSATNLVVDNSFCRALPSTLGEVFECLDSRQRITMKGMLELRGTQRPIDPITAAWDMEAQFFGGTVTIGLDYKDLAGTVRARGIWNGYETDLNGRIAFRKAKVLDHQLTDIHGPFQVKNGMLVVGARDAVLHTPGQKPSGTGPIEHVTAKAIDGVIRLDAASTLETEPTYRVRMTLTNGKLERYAQLYMPDQKNLRGVMNGWVVLSGRGNSAADVRGRGQLQIQPAALYEMPVVAQVFNVLSFAPPDRTAFRHALLDFGISDEKFRFNGIYLDGTAISLRGRGTAAFDGTLELDFYSMLPQNHFPIPVVNVIMREATRGWMGIKVRGNIDDPHAETRPVPNLDDRLKGFLNALPTLGPPVMPPPPPVRPRAPR